MSDIVIKEPIFLWFCIAIPVYYIIYYFYSRKNRVKLSSIEMFDKKKWNLSIIIEKTIDVLKLIALCLLAVAASNPMKIEVEEKKVYEGIPVVIALDISGSMLADDFQPNRLEIAKEKAKSFILQRAEDRIGLVAYAGDAYTVSPITLSKDFLLKQIESIRTGLIEDGTAIGNGLASSINLIKDIDADGKIIILISDGVNNAGQIDPMLAAEIANMYDIKVYTISIGTQSTARVPENYDGTGKLIEADVQLDTETLISISQATGGKYFAANSPDALTNIYNEIDNIERTKYQIQIITNEISYSTELNIMALLIIVLHFILRTTKYKSIP